MTRAVEHSLLCGSGGSVTLQSDAQLLAPEFRFRHNPRLRRGTLTAKHSLHVCPCEPPAVPRPGRLDLLTRPGRYGEPDIAQIARDPGARMQKNTRNPAAWSHCAEQVTRCREERLAVTKDERAVDGKRSHIFRTVTKNIPELFLPWPMPAPAVAQSERCTQCTSQRPRMRGKQTCNAILWRAAGRERRPVTKEQSVLRIESDTDHQPSSSRPGSARNRASRSASTPSSRNCIPLSPVVAREGPRSFRTRPANSSARLSPSSTELPVRLRRTSARSSSRTSKPAGTLPQSPGLHRDHPHSMANVSRIR